MFARADSIQTGLQKVCRIFLVVLCTVPYSVSAPQDADSVPASLTKASLSVDEVVNNLVRADAERARALHNYQCDRIYRLSYRGFPGDREAEMRVVASYQSPTTKTFKITSQSGSKLVIDRVFKRLLESEKEAAEPEMHARTLLDRANYDFALLGMESSDRGSQYVLAVTPKTKSKYLYRGKVWVDAKDFAVTRIEAEPAQNPSFWTKKSEIRHDYVKVQNFWLPRHNESISYIRLGGRATLTIDYNHYRVNDSNASQSATQRHDSSGDVQ
jgi:ribonuclease HI